MPDVYSCDVVHNEKLTDRVYAVTISCPEIAGAARPGQFINIKCGADSLLRRPISICGVDEDEIRFVFEVKGAGTSWLSRRVPGRRLDVLGPLGNGYHIPDGDIIVVGGGVGTPPLLFAAASSTGAVSAVIGFSDSRAVILRNEFETVCDSVCVTTDDGSSGIRGTVSGPLTELLEKGGNKPVLACGPQLMLRAVADICDRFGAPCQVSMEERMACGVGACVVCACATQRDGAQGMSLVCKDGPVFDAREVVWREQ